VNAIYTMSGQPGMTQQDLNNLGARVARIEKITPYLLGGGSLASSDFSTIDSAGLINGKLNLTSSSSIDVKGIMSPNVVDGQFSVAKPSDSSAVIYWDGTNSSRVILIRRPDSQGQGLNGTSTTVPPSNITITGLTHDLTYQILPYWVPFNACGIGFAPGTVGTPKIAFLSTDSDTTFAQGRAIQSLMGREPLGNVSWTQPAAGGSSGGGTPINPPARQPGTCVMLGTHLKPLGNEEIDTVNHRWTDWVRIETEPGGVFTNGLNCTPNHPLYDSECGKVEASFFVGKNRWIITERGEEKVTNTTQFIKDCTKVEARMKSGHIFFANGFMSHNVKNQLDQT
jgi:hypothetical protein